VNSPVKQDSLAATVAFSTIGRRSNRINYKVYEILSDTFTEAVPSAGETVAKGQAVEFRYWATTFDPDTAGADVINVANTGTHYALFYLDNDELKVDYGTVSGGTGGVGSDGRRITSNIRTVILARDVDVAENNEIFSHSVIGGVGSGVTRMDLSPKNDEGEMVEVKTATFLRVTWPQ